MELRDKDTLALSVSSTSEDVVINLLMQKRREFLSASKFVSQLPSHSWSKKMPYCWLKIKYYLKFAFCFHLGVCEIHIYVLPSQYRTLAERTCSMTEIQHCSHFTKLGEGVAYLKWEQISAHNNVPQQVHELQYFSMIPFVLQPHQSDMFLHSLPQAVILSEIALTERQEQDC